MCSDQCLGIDFFRKLGQRPHDAAEVVRRQAVFGLFDRDEREHGGTQLVDVEGGVQLASKHSGSEIVHRQHKRDVQDGLLTVAESREVDSRFRMARREVQAQVP